MITADPILLEPHVIRFYADHPIDYVKEVIGATPDDNQGPILESCANNQLTSVRSGHGIGKSAVESWIIKWFMYSRPFPKVPCTAPTKHQLHDILWAELNRWNRDAADGSLFEWTDERFYHKAHREEWFAVPRTAVKADALQGFHAEHVFYVLDEASGVKDEIFEPVLGALSTEGAKLLACGNPTQLAGWFFDSHNKNRAMYSVFHVDGRNSSRVSKQFVQMIIDMYGEDSDVFRVRVAGEFPKAIAHCCAGKNKTAGSYHFKYTEGSLKRDQGYNCGKNNAKARKVYCIELNKYWNTIKECADQIGCTPQAISKVCGGKGNTAKRLRSLDFTRADPGGYPSNQNIQPSCWRVSRSCWAY
jgi:hypothetical protein